MNGGTDSGDDVKKALQSECAIDAGDPPKARDTSRCGKNRRRRIVGLLGGSSNVPTRNAAMKIWALLVVMCLLSTFSVVSEESTLVASAEASLFSFSLPVIVNDNQLNDQMMPIIVGVPGGDLFVAWQDSRSGTEDIYASISRDNGATFSPNKRADDSTVSSKQLEPAVAVSRDGIVMLSWQDNRRGAYDYDIYFAKTHDGGLAFTKNLKVDDSNGVFSWQERPSIAVNSDGVIYVAWTDDRTGILRVRGAYSVDGGVTFSPSAEVAPTMVGSGQTGVAVVANGESIFAAFVDNTTGTTHPYVCVSTDGGQSFSSPTRIDDAGVGVMQHDISIAPMPGGGICAAWEDSRGGDWDIYATIVSASGAVSMPNIKVDDDLTGAFQRDVSVATDTLGNIYAAWEDDRDQKYAIRFAYLEARGTQFSASTAVAAPSPLDMQKRPSVVVKEPGTVYVAWQDDKAGSYDIYVASAHYPNLLGLSLVSGWNFVSVPLVNHGYNASTLGLAPGDEVVGFNPATQEYDQIFVVGWPIGDFVIEGSTGYWVYAAEPSRLVLSGDIPTAPQSRSITVPIGGGWAAVGFNSFSGTLQASDIPGMCGGGTVTEVASYDPVAGYSIYAPGWPFPDFSLLPGHAYWVWCTASLTMTYTP